MPHSIPALILTQETAALSNPEPHAKGEKGGHTLAARPSAALGLSKGHISPSITIWKGAGIVQVTEGHDVKPQWNDFEEKQKRGKISGFSRKSQSLLRRQMAKIPDKEWVSAFLITLTYPAEFPDITSEGVFRDVYKRDLDVIKKRIQRIWDCSGFWVLEFQERGAPHYHFVCFGIDPSKLTKFQAWLAKAWFDVVGSGSIDHLKAGTSVELPRTPAKARNYIAKYASKNDSKVEGIYTGRYWGVMNRKKLPVAEEIKTELSPAFAVKVSRIARNLVKRRVRESQLGRLRRMIGENYPPAKTWSDSYFRTLLQTANRSNFAKLDDLESLKALSRVEKDTFFLMWQMDVRQIRVPSRWRMRNNKTTNLFCDADSFAASIQNHPDYEEKQNETKPRTLSKSWNVTKSALENAGEGTTKPPHRWKEELETNETGAPETYALPRWGETRAEFRIRKDPF